MLRAPNIILTGGPDIPDGDRVQYAENTAERFKLFRGNRYEHFDPTQEFELHLGQRVQVFHWVRSTFVAE
jgi:hypothetical protein